MPPLAPGQLGDSGRPDLSDPPDLSDRPDVSDRPGLPGHWRARRPERSDAPAIHTLIAECDIAVLGYPDIALGDVLVDLGRDADRQIVVLDGEELLAWAMLHDKVAGRTIADVYVQVGLDRVLGDRLAAWCWAQQVGHAAQIAQRRGLGSTMLDTGMLAGDVCAESRLRAAGFTHQRTFWRMQRPLVAGDATPMIAPGVTIREVTDADLTTTYDVLEAAFADHWHSHPRTFEEWRAQVTGNAGSDQSLWWLAEIDGRPAGALIATRQMADEDALYIATLGTLRAARGRGVGTSLLRQAFAAGRREGWSTAKLNVDSESTTAAPALYATVGMTVEFATQAWSMTVTAG